MMRVEVNMGPSFRGFIDEYAEETDKTMPQAYKDLMEIGLLIADEVDINQLDSDVNIPHDVKVVAQRDEEEYDLIIKESG